MRSTLALLALATSAAAQAVTSLVIPSSTPPAGCQNSHQGTFQLSVVSANGSVISPTPSRRSFDLKPRQSDGNLQLTLTGGILMDSKGRTGYIASNYQFQFDGPPQAGAIYTAGFTFCPNSSLALGGSAIFWQCKSGNFYNLYDRDWAVHCDPVYFQAAGATGAAFSTAPPASEVTGPDQATVPNAGGTQSQNLTTTGFGGAAPTTSGSMMMTGSASGSAATSGSAAGGSGGSGGSSASATAATASQGGAAAIATDAAQTLLAWAVGMAGALALI